MSRRTRVNPESVQDAFNDMRSDYAAAKAGRFRRRRTGILSTGSHADYHFRNENDMWKLMEVARDMDRNDCLIGTSLDRACTNILQSGINPDPDTGDDGLNTELYNRWEEWASNPDECDAAGERNFHAMARLALRHAFLDGDCFALPLESGRLQLLEAHRCRTPRGTKKNVVLGVMLDDQRRRLEYWFTKEDVGVNGSVNRVNEITPIEARNSNGNRQVFHIYDPKRITQTRGVSALAPVFDIAGMFEDLNFAKLVQAQIVSCVAFIRKRNAGWTPPGGKPGQVGERTTETRADGTSRIIEGIAPGIELIGEAGEEIEGFSPHVPNAEFFDHVRLLLTLYGINIGLPLCVMLMDGSETNFSGFRGAVDEARKGFRHNQGWLGDRLHRETYSWRARRAMDDDPKIAAVAQKSGVNVFRCKWNPPTWPYIQPLQDAQTDLLRQRNVRNSPRRLHAERGRDWEDVADETVADNLYAIRAAKKAAAELNKEFKDDNSPVHWRELISLPTPDGVTITVAAQEDMPPVKSGATQKKGQPA